jgi:hypothetical protein
MLGLHPLWQLHIDVYLNWSLWISHNKAHLSKGPTEYDSEGDHKPDCEPCHNVGVCLKIVHSVDLLSAM